MADIAELVKRQKELAKLKNDGEALYWAGQEAAAALEAQTARIKAQAAEIEILKGQGAQYLDHRIAALEAENKRLREENESRKRNCEHWQQQLERADLKDAD